MTDGKNLDDKTEAVLDANDLLDRIEEHTVDGLKPDGDPNDALGDIVEELETSPEAENVRKAGDRTFRGATQDPGRDHSSDQAVAEAEASDHPS